MGGIVNVGVLVGVFELFFGGFVGGDVGVGVGVVVWGCRMLVFFGGDEVVSVEGLGEVGLVVVSYDG